MLYLCQCIVAINRGSQAFQIRWQTILRSKDKSYGLQYAKAIYEQWGQSSDTHSLYGRRNKIFTRSRDYANGTQDTTIYKQLLNSLGPEKGDGSLLNLDYTPVPILPKFVKIVMNKILSRDPYPNLESIDPISSSEKNKKKDRIKMQVQARQGAAGPEGAVGCCARHGPRRDSRNDGGG